MKNKELFLSDQSIAYDFIEKFTYYFEVLPHIEEFILQLGKQLNEDYVLMKENVWVHKTATISPSASITGPCIIDANTEIRHHAFIRGKAIIGKNCVLGNSCEIKNSILFDHVQVPHFNYVGDSILGFHAHMGAGSICSNIKVDKANVIIKNMNQKIETNLRKVGAAIGDYAEIGCNSVLNPGTIIGVHSNIYPLTNVRGVVPPHSIVKDMDHIILKDN